MEIWKPVKTYEGFYEISSLGRVKNLKRKVRCRFGYRTIPERILKKAVNKSNGYEYVAFSKKSKIKTFSVHRLVCQAFHENLSKRKDVNHINHIKTDNRSINLEWNTRSENMIHCYGDLGCNYPLGGDNALSKSVIQMDKHGLFVARFPSSREAAIAVNGHRNGISRCCRGGRKHHRGYKWKYEY